MGKGQQVEVTQVESSLKKGFLFYKKKKMEWGVFLCLVCLIGLFL